MACSGGCVLRATGCASMGGSPPSAASAAGRRTASTGDSATTAASAWAAASAYTGGYASSAGCAATTAFVNMAGGSRLASAASRSWSRHRRASPSGPPSYAHPHRRRQRYRGRRNALKLRSQRKPPLALRTNPSACAWLVRPLSRHQSPRRSPRHLLPPPRRLGPHDPTDAGRDEAARA
jgi:hypothetical protein